MASEYSFQFTEKALSDLDEITDYLVNTLGQRPAAQSLIDKTDQEIHVICRYPESGTPVINEYIRRSDIRKLVVEKYVLYYITDKENQKNIVLRIVYGKRDLETIMRELGIE